MVQTWKKNPPPQTRDQKRTQRWPVETWQKKCDHEKGEEALRSPTEIQDERPSELETGSNGADQGSDSSAKKQNIQARIKNYNIGS